MMLHRTTMTTPIGELVLVASDAGLREIRLPLPERRPPSRAVDDADHPVLRKAVDQLAAYFRGERTDFDLPLDVEGSPFQRDVWRSLQTIPYGATDTYGGLATRLGRAGAARAVGGANGANPLPIVVPCHRVIAATGALTGYGGPSEDGIAIKRWLLRHEATVDAA
jgi:methylated-DNA-[protein]-cysteine S-methyltransferase